MLNTYFFIPAQHPKLFEKLKTIKADHLIIDLEDSIAENEEEDSLDKICALQMKENYWVRPRLTSNTHIRKKQFDFLLQKGFRNFIIPKLRNQKQFFEIEDILKNRNIEETNFIVLIENAEILENINHILSRKILNVCGLGFGSQDYCTETGMNHNLDYLRIPRFQIMNIAKAHYIECIDIASMDVEVKSTFEAEVVDAYNMGYSAKFIIHPKQLDYIKKYRHYSEEELNRAKDILLEYEVLGKPALFKKDGQLIERPHIEFYRKLLKNNL